MTFGSDLDEKGAPPIRKDQVVCSECQKQFRPKTPVERISTAECPHCGAVVSVSGGNETLDNGSFGTTALNVDSSSSHGYVSPANNDEGDEDEIQLCPAMPSRAMTTTVVEELANSPEFRELRDQRAANEQNKKSEYQVEPVSPGSRSPSSRQSPLPGSANVDKHSTHASAPFPSGREYPVLESISNNSRRLAWVTATIVLLHLGYELYATLSSEGPERTLSQFSRYSFLVVVGCTAAVSLFLGLAEAIHVALDIESNTLEMCKEMRRKRNGQDSD